MVLAVSKKSAYESTIKEASNTESWSRRIGNTTVTRCISLRQRLRLFAGGVLHLPRLGEGGSDESGGDGKDA